MISEMHYRIKNIIFCTVISFKLCKSYDNSCNDFSDSYIESYRWKMQISFLISKYSRLWRQRKSGLEEFMWEELNGCNCANGCWEKFTTPSHASGVRPREKNYAYLVWRAYRERYALAWRPSFSALVLIGTRRADVSD